VKRVKALCRDAQGEREKGRKSETGIGRIGGKVILSKVREEGIIHG